MKKLSKITAIVLSVVCLSGLFSGVSACKSDTPTANVVTLKDNGEKITNPNMGWNFTYYANTVYDFNNTLKEGDYLDDFPCDIVFFRIGWNWLEPQEGVYNWEFIDDIASEWISRGKRIALCFVVTFIGDQSTPLWVKDAGAQGQDYFWCPKVIDYDNDGQPIYTEAVGDELNENGERILYSSWWRNGVIVNNTSMTFTGVPLDAQEYARNVGIRNDSDYNGGEEVAVGDFENYRGTWVPDYDDPVFLAKLENFLSAAATHYESETFHTQYDNDPDFDIDFLEIGSFGDWGEGHSSYTHLNTITESMVKKHMDIYSKCFKKIHIQANDSIFDKYPDLTQYALDKGFGVSDHTVQVPKDGTTEGWTANSSVARNFYKEQPVLLENHNGTQIMETYYNGVVDCYATWARINCNPNTCKFSEWTDKITLRLGYRLTFTEIAFDNVNAGEKVRIQFKIKNTGSAFCYDGGNPTFYLIDSLGRIKSFAVSDFDVKSLEPKRNPEKLVESVGTATLEIPSKMLAGDYYLCVSVSKGLDDKGNPNDVYNLPLNHKDGEKLRYRIATFNVPEV